MQIYSFSKERKRLANLAVNAAIKSGKLKPLDYCEICYYSLEMLAEEGFEETETLFGQNINIGHLISAHHFNYRYPLRVWWLCMKCHSVLHALQRKYKIACITIEGARKLINDNRSFYNKHTEVETPNYYQEEFY